MEREELIERMVSDVMENFDFENVRKVMVFLDWRWSIENGELTVPSSYRLMKTADRLLRECAKHYGEKEFFSVGTGGLHACLEQEALRLQFILEDILVDKCDYEE